MHTKNVINMPTELFLAEMKLSSVMLNILMHYIPSKSFLLLTSFIQVIHMCLHTDKMASVGLLHLVWIYTVYKKAQIRT